MTKDTRARLLDPATLTPRDIDRFWSKVSKAGPDDCWDWTGGINATGYGHFNLRAGVTLRAHRVAWALANGRPFPSRALALHSCDRPSCCNPAHLRPGTHRDNVHDMDSRGRRRTVSIPRPGELNPAHKLTESQVIEIHSLAAAGETHTAIAPRFGVSRSAISRILRREVWKHIGAAA